MQASRSTPKNVDTATLRCAYLVSRYPSTTHTFVLREVAALRERGVEVRTASVRRWPRPESFGPDERAEAARTHVIVPAGAGRLLRALAAAWRQRRPVLRSTLTLWRGSPPGLRARLWSLFYAAEGLLLWHWMDDAGLRHVHVHHANVSADLAMMAVALGGPDWRWSLTLHGPTELLDPVGHNLARKLRAADAVVLIGEFLRERVVAAAPGLDPRRLRLVHCGLPLRPSAPATPSSGPIRLLNVGQLEPRKGQHLLLQAVSDLRSRGMAVALTIVGGGSQRAALELQARQLGLADSVRFTGPLSAQQVRDCYAQADLFCLPSLAEGIPIVLMEAMAAGLPVIASAIDGIPELVIDEVNGLLVPAGDVQALAGALGRLATSVPLRQSLGAAAPRRVREAFDGAVAAQRLEGIFREIQQRPEAAG